MDYKTPPPVRVRGDWMPDGESYPALLAGRWNGWAVPLVTREVADQIVSDQQKMIAESPEWYDAVLSWNGDAIVVAPPLATPDDWEPYEVRPGANGLYDVSFGWTWETVNNEPEPDPADPTPAQLAAFGELKAQHPDVWELWSGSRLVLEDGSHVFDIRRVTGRDGGEVFTELVKAVRIDRDGNVTDYEPEEGQDV